ncbi:hypothetical protein Ddye_029447 [Dipteronia dyeriana]|uniref:Uncharacterized protein n=1 Tax=Dipteronia dyeriana TaxID=168575 RepID=A0AAD9TEF9_9ROSI|nr:hypothetical protein Ddye_029447 [Dipteronia dyeriana]
MNCLGRALWIGLFARVNLWPLRIRDLFGWGRSVNVLHVIKHWDQDASGRLASSRRRASGLYRRFWLPSPSLLLVTFAVVAASGLSVGGFRSG